MTRMEALEAVAEAAMAWWEAGASPSVEHARAVALRQALHALDALPASPPGEVVEVAVWKWPNGIVALATVGSDEDERWGEHDCWRLGTVRLALVKEAGDAG